jgi:hypothetical protein
MTIFGWNSREEFFGGSLGKHEIIYKTNFINNLLEDSWQPDQIKTLFFFHFKLAREIF